MYRFTQNQDVIRLLLMLKTAEQDYPFPLISQRRSTFVGLVYKYLFWRPRG
jgi:hypothetical protein